MLKKAIVSCLLMMIFSLNTASAESDASLLPWGMTWDTSLKDYVSLLEQNTPEAEYTILEQPSASGGAVYIINKPTQGQPLSLDYQAVFLGEPTAGKLMSHPLADLENKPLQLQWMAIDIAQSNPVQEDILSSDVFRCFEDLYASYALAYGTGNQEYSYIAATSVNHETTYYTLPMENGSIDFRSIENQFHQMLGDLSTYWLVIGSGHASCRFYVTSAAGIDGETVMIWRYSYYFTKELQGRRSGVDSP